MASKYRLYNAKKLTSASIVPSSEGLTGEKLLLKKVLLLVNIEKIIPYKNDNYTNQSGGYFKNYCCLAWNQ